MQILQVPEHFIKFIDNKSKKSKFTDKNVHKSHVHTILEVKKLTLIIKFFYKVKFINKYKANCTS